MVFINAGAAMLEYFLITYFAYAICSTKNIFGRLKKNLASQNFFWPSFFEIIENQKLLLVVDVWVKKYDMISLFLVDILRKEISNNIAVIRSKDKMSRYFTFLWSWILHRRFRVWWLLGRWLSKNYNEQSEIESILTITELGKVMSKFFPPSPKTTNWI